MAVWLALGVVLASLCAGLVAVACFLWTNRLQTSAPGPPAVPLLGNALHFYKQPVLLDRFTELHRKYGDVFRFYVGPKLVVVVTQPEDIKEILITSKQMERDLFFMRLLQMTIGNGLLTNSNETWKRHRKLIEPAFHFEALQKYLDTFNEEGHLLCDNLMATGGAEVDVYPVFCVHTLRIVLSTICGVPFNCIEPEACSQVKLVAEIIHCLTLISVAKSESQQLLCALLYSQRNVTYDRLPLASRNVWRISLILSHKKMMMLPWKTVNGFFWMTFEGRELKRIIKVCKNFTQRYIDVLREQTSIIKGNERTHLTSLTSEGFLQETELENLLRDEVLTLALTGSETAAASMGFTLALLGLHPEWQQKAQRELDQVFGNGGDFLRPVTVEDLSKLTVIDAIIKESLRLFPTAPITPRLVDRDIPLAGGRYVAPRGCCVFLALFLMHRHPELFPDPDEFDPGRFLPGGSATSRRSYSYLPFSTGPRRCIGEPFVTMEIKILLATVLRRFHIMPGSSKEELDTIMFSISSHPLTGYRVSCVPREVPTS